MVRIHAYNLGIETPNNGADQMTAKHNESLLAFHKHQAAQAAYFGASMEYAKALGYGTATRAQRLELVRLKDAYYAR